MFNLEAPIRYRVVFQPLSSENVYGDEIDVSDKITINGIKKIRRSIDAGDYNIGVFTYDDITLTGINFDGYFNDPLDSRSIFRYNRDRCKVTVKYIQFGTDGEETATITFRGLINEEATRVNPEKDEIRFKVLSRDSVIRTTKVPSGTVTNGTSVSTAILNILSTPKIQSVLNVDAGNINPDLDVTVDVGSELDNRPTKDALNELLLVSNSVLIIDSSDNVIVRSREENGDSPVLNLYGKHDIHRRENILSIKDYNTGLHRVFSSVMVNGQETSDSQIAKEYVERQKEITIDFITDDDTENDIAARLLRDFKVPKIEVRMRVPTHVAKDYDLLDLVSINYPLRVKPILGQKLPVIGITEVGESGFPLPDTFGSLVIEPNLAFKIIQIDEYPKDFITELKLRQIGITFSDGVFNAPGSNIVGFAVIGDAELGSGDLEGEIYNPGIVGGGQIGESKAS